MSKDLKEKIDSIVIPQMEVVPKGRKKLFAKKQEEPQVEIPEVIIPKTKNEEYTEAVVRLRGSSKQTSAYKRRVKNNVGAESADIVDPIMPVTKTQPEPVPSVNTTPYHDLFEFESEKVTEMRTVERTLEKTSERTNELASSISENSASSTIDAKAAADSASFEGEKVALDGTASEAVCVTQPDSTVERKTNTPKTEKKKFKTSEKSARLKPISNIILTDEREDDGFAYETATIKSKEKKAQIISEPAKEPAPEVEKNKETLFTDSAKNQNPTFSAMTYIPFAWLHSLSNVNRPSKTYKKLLYDQQERALLLPVLGDDN